MVAGKAAQEQIHLARATVAGAPEKPLTPENKLVVREDLELFRAKPSSFDPRGAVNTYLRIDTVHNRIIVADSRDQSINFLDKKLTVTLSVQDIFFSNKYNYSLDQGPISLTGERYNDSRRYAINVRYNFGLKLKEDKKEFLNGEGAESP